jgi:hypothetical protein
MRHRLDRGRAFRAGPNRGHSKRREPSQECPSGRQHGVGDVRRPCRGARSTRRRLPRHWREPIPPPAQSSEARALTLGVSAQTILEPGPGDRDAEKFFGGGMDIPDTHRPLRRFQYLEDCLEYRLRLAPGRREHRRCPRPRAETGIQGSQPLQRNGGARVPTCPHSLHSERASPFLEAPHHQQATPGHVFPSVPPHPGPPCSWVASTSRASRDARGGFFGEISVLIGEPSTAGGGHGAAPLPGAASWLASSSVRHERGHR